MRKLLYKTALLLSSVALISCGTELKKEDNSDSIHQGALSLSSSTPSKNSKPRATEQSATGTSQDSLILSRTPVKLNILKSNPQLTHALEALSNFKNMAQQELKVVSITDARAEVVKTRNGRKTATSYKTAGSDKTVQLTAKLDTNNINVDISLEAETVKMAALTPNQKITVNKTEFGFMLLADNSPIAGVQK